MVLQLKLIFIRIPRVSTLIMITYVLPVFDIHLFSFGSCVET